MVSRLIKKINSDSPVLAIVLIVLTAVIAHGLFISRLGYYYDDWYMLWSGAIRGRDSLVPLFSIDRPFIGVIYSFLYRFLHDNLLGWHLAALFMRIGGGIAFYWILNLAWPQVKRYTTLAAMLFVVFPGFLAEPNAATKINHLIGYGAALFSIAFSLQAVKTTQRGWRAFFTALSLLLMALYLWIYEYMLGLEVMRIALLYWVLWQGERKQILLAAKKVVLVYIPNLLVMALFLTWRVFIFDSTRPSTDLRGLVYDYRDHPLTMLIRLIFQGVSDFFSASTFAWFVQPYQLLAKVDFGEIAIALLAAAAVVLLAVGYTIAVRKREDTDQELPSGVVLILIGVLIALAAVFPVVLLNKHIDLMDPYKAYALHPSAGVIIAIIGLLLLLQPRYRKITLVLLLGYSVATQAMNNQAWAKFWEVQKGMWWQLTWRAPDIRDKTLLMAYLPTGFVFQQDYEVWAPVNLIYRPAPENSPLIPSEVLNQDTVFNVYEGSFTEPHVRDIYVPKDFKNFLLISQPTTNSCIRVIDGDMPAYSTSERPLVKVVGATSDVGLISTTASPPVPTVAIFGNEPEHGWCYYFQQASLARQVGNWAKIGELYQAARAAGLRAADPSEYFVFIEGLVNLGQEEAASQMATEFIRDNPALKTSLCQSLANAPAYPASFGYRHDAIEQIVCQPSD